MVSRRTTDRGFGATLTTSIDASPGNLEVDVDFEGDDAPSGSYAVRIGFEGLNNIASQYSRFVSNLQSNFSGGGVRARVFLNQLPFNIPTSRSAVIPDDFERFRDGLVRIGSFNLQPSIGPDEGDGTGGGFSSIILQTDVPEVGGAEVNESYGERFNWRPVPIPNSPQLGITPPTLRSFNIVVEVRRTERFQPSRTWRTDTSISAQILVDERDVRGDLDCFEAFPDIERELDGIASRRAAEIISDVDNAEDVVGRVKSVITSEDRNAPSAFRADIEELTASIGRGGVDNLKQDLRAASIDMGAVRDLTDDIEDLQRRMENKGQCAEQLLSRLRNSLADPSELLDRADRIESERQRLLDFLGRTGGIECSVQFDRLDRRIRRVEEAAGIGRGGISTTFERIDRNLALIDDIMDDVEAIDDDSGGCRAEFRSRLREARGILRRKQRDPSLSGLDCEDVDLGVRRIVDNFEEDVRQFASKDITDRRPEELNDLVDRASVVRDTIRTNVEDANPCKDNLLGRVDTQISQVRRSRTFTEREVPCKDRFEEIGNSLDDFEDKVLALDAPVEPQEFQEVVREGDRIIGMIEEDTEAGTKCRNQFVRRTRTLVDRAERLTARVRIQTVADSEDQREREQLLSDILGTLNRLEQQRQVPDSVEGLGQST